MRLWLIIAAVIAAGVLVVVIPPLLSSDEAHTPRPGHQETLAAATALVYARAMEVGDEQMACDTMTTDAGRAVGCGTADARPRHCGNFDIEKTLVINHGSSRATIEVGNCRIELLPGAETRWAVSKVAPA